ncbi:ECF transporter S component [Spiroplasma diminutum]|uniref:Transmembrane protein n=1 Tax=Spiroplasma diminutum CUAS-1 TaxID=1276221 RepID=S5ME05_9MOLU|nr:ECF transporter S component [Spiroplasma diminutum]AGR41953.1 transmembrane protein [Spiroplasma diminutum CUAS-1]
MEEKNHNIPEHDDVKEGKKDHYHDEHHFDSLGNHDDINDEDFHWKNSIYTSRRNLTFRITLTGVFLALAIALSAFEMLYEGFLEKMTIAGGVAIPFRILDILVITLSLAAIGPVFSGIIAFIVPFIHLMDGHHGNALTILIDSLGYFVSIWVIWFSYYFIFRNSSIHKHPIKSVDRFKRWTPMAIYVPIMAIIYTLLVFAMIYITTNSGHDDHDHDHLDLISNLGITTYHGDHEHSGEWSAVKENLGLFIGVISAVQIVRFSICYALFALIEPQVKKINHYYK